MGTSVKSLFNQGWVTARDRGDLEPGELQTATGIYYKPGDPARAHKIGGRGFSSDNASNSVVVAANPIKGLYLAQYDSGGTDYLYALPSTAGGIYRKTTALSGTFAAVSSELTTAASTLSGAHVNNRHYLCNGTDLNMVAESDGTARRMGMNPPLEAPTAAASTVTQVFARPTAEAANNYGAGVEGWLKTDKAVDSGTDFENTFAYVTIGKADQYSSAKEQEWRFASYVAASSRLEVMYRLTTGNINTNPGTKIGSGGSESGRFKVRIIIKYSITGGGTNTYIEIVNAVLETSMTDVITIQIPLADATYNPAAGTGIRVICSATLISKGDGVSFRIADIRMAKGGAASNITTTTGFYYAVTEYDQTRNQESGPSPVSAIVTMTANNLVTLTLPTATQNSRATHWRIYRTPDGGVAPSQLGRVETIGIAQTTWADSFIRAYDVQAPYIVDLLPTQAAEGTLYYPFHGVPPTCKQFFVHRGRLCGIPATSDRALAYSEPGWPESWPTVNSDDDFPLQEGDRLVAGCSVGDTLIMFCGVTVVTMLDVASWSDGQFRATQKHTLRGAPGLVNQDAFAVFTADGSPMVAWVSYQGVYMTDGHTAARISDEHQWSSIITSVSALSYCKLHWDQNRQCLVFAYDSDGGGTNDRFALIHMAPEHRKANGQPKWTGPHYGSIVAMASGWVSGTYRLWSGHVSDGKVYVEDTGTVDQSSSYSSTQVPLIVTTARLYGDTLGREMSWRDWAVYKANLRHTAAGGSETVSVAWSAGWDSGRVTQSVTKTPSIVTQRGDEFYVGLGGEWHEITFTHTGSASWAVLDLRMEATAMGRSGRVA